MPSDHGFDSVTPEHAITVLLERRAGKTICPSEAARVVAGPGGDWRAQMASVHRAVAHMLKRGAIRLSWKGSPKSAPKGPYRIASAADG
ncbi:hypothetical protein HME9302_01893 [Alteripontixanthobacter maritimus]|uniref:DUF3253 domain-containing protein n=1 Tax=Alteripontixanthobacter maritimus TaxID=2161824 RepID=A0A369QEG3_9SPHN|nr:DUF3253 domain-containing protein [Alteripontixanthobacter maritimus]RDC60678.1 hypothetical protein HME9302_01893 [Alteripontixanthobacter maritimus]